MKRSAKHQSEHKESRTHKRFEAGLGSSMALAILAIWAVGGRLQDGFQMASATGVPLTGGPGSGIWIVIAVLILLNTLLIGAETAVAALRQAHLRIAKEKNGKRFEKLESLVERQSKVVAACALATQIARLAIYASTFLLAPGLLDLFADRFGWSRSLATLLGAWLILLIPVALVHLMLADLLAKSYALVHPMRVATSLYGLINATAFLFAIPAGVVTNLRTRFTSRFISAVADESTGLAEEEIKSLAESAHETGELVGEERELLHSVFEFTDTVAREVMTPRVDIDAMSVRSDPTEVAKLIQESGHSRIPLYEDTDDQIVGIIHAKDLFGAMLNGKAPNLRSLMRPALYVPENKSLHELLAEMRQSRSQMAVVQDEFGGTAGIVTIEDIVEELVGDIIDEYDVEEPEIVEAAGGWLVDGRTHIDDLNEVLPSTLESDEFDTVGGFVFGLFGRQPKLGDAVETEGLKFIVAESDGRRITRLKVEPLPEQQTLAILDRED